MKKNKYKKYTRRKIVRNRLITLTALLLIFIATKNYIIPSLIGKNKTTTTVSTDISTKTTEVKNTPKDTDIIPGYNISYGGDKYAVSADDVSNIINGKNIDDKKYIFLTFDDGPSPNTEKVLNILKEKNVKATFFMLGNNITNYDNAKTIIKRCITEGNAIGNHTYTHDFKKLYPNNSVNTTTYIEEFNKTNTLLKSILGSDFNARVTRMPGGYNSRQYYKDAALPIFDETLKKNNVVSIDWTSLNGDAEGKNYSSNDLLNNAIKNSHEQSQIVILMHDTYGKEKTVQMLPALIDHFKNNGYEFKTIKNSSINDDNINTTN